MKNVLVIGGGAAGMMAAVFASRKGAKVTLLERNEKLGKKLYITGKGRCNVTNACDPETFIRETPRNGRFLYSALSFFSPEDMMAFLEKEGCPVVVERGRRVFPASHRASDVTRTLERAMRGAGVTVRLNARVKSLMVQDGHVLGARLLTDEVIWADAVIVATGGKSYPMTGSTGDGYAFFEETGHTVITPAPALSALKTQESWPMALQGLSLKNVTLTLLKGNKKVYQDLGEMLFTHFGVSGPLVIEASSHMEPEKPDQYRLLIDLKPGLTLEQLDARLMREFEAAPNKQLKSILPELLPGKLALIFPEAAGMDAGAVINQVSREQRLKLGQCLKALPISIRALCPIQEAIITRGGLSVRELHAGTMQSKRIRGLFAAGETVDVDAHTGGYNLQIAFSTGALAGDKAAEEEI